MKVAVRREGARYPMNIASDKSFWIRYAIAQALTVALAIVAGMVADTLPDRVLDVPMYLLSRPSIMFLALAAAIASHTGAALNSASKSSQGEDTLPPVRASESDLRRLLLWSRAAKTYATIYLLLTAGVTSFMFALFGGVSVVPTILGSIFPSGPGALAGPIVVLGVTAVVATVWK